MRKSIFSSVSKLFAATDEQVMWRVCTQDDPHAFAQLVERWESPIQRLCTRMLGDLSRGEDLAQETFARLFAKRKDYQPSGRFSTFLWRIAMNLCYDELRRQKRRPEARLDEVSPEAAADLPSFTVVPPTPDAQLLRQEEGELVRRAVLQLSEAYRSVVVLRHYEDLKFKEIAEVLGIPEGTVKSRMAEALVQLHRMLARAFDDNPSDLCHTQRKRREPSLVL